VNDIGVDTTEFDVHGHLVLPCLVHRQHIHGYNFFQKAAPVPTLTDYLSHWLQ